MSSYDVSLMDVYDILDREWIYTSTGSCKFSELCLLANGNLELLIIESVI